MNEILICKEWNDDDVNKIRNGIINYNSGMNTDYPRVEAINIILKNSVGETLGGVLGKVYLLGFYVDILWVDESLRKLGYGSKLLSEVEIAAKEKGCKFIHLDTFSFQAPNFYKKHGYEVFGILEGYPDGITRYYLKKVI